MIEKRDFYINGAWVAPAAANDCDVINPSNEEVCAVISLGDQADTNAAVAAAKAAFPAWSTSTKEVRMAALERLLAAYNDRAEDMAQAISLEMGAPISMARTSQTTSGSWHLQGFIKAFETFEFDSMLRDDAPNDRILREPIGVCALITPWNWPMNQVMLKVAGALAAGCTMVLKPSEIAPLSSIVFTEIMDAADIPAGVYNMVHGDGVGVGSQLTVHPDVDMVSFTGSTRAGTAITKASADTIKRVALELGGKGANVIFADADEKAVKRGVLHMMNNTGQSCNAPSRMLVERSYYDQAVEIATETANKVAVGLASEEGRHMGPVVSEVQFDKIQALIQKGIDEGARVVAGGTGRPEGMNRGYFIRPTVFADVNSDMTIAREEIFGPVMAMIPFDTEEEAIAITNDTVYGLTNYVQTQDKIRALRVARAMRSGMVEINGVGRSQGAPFGGYKQSGIGREGGHWGIEDFLETKSVGGWVE